MCSGDNTPFIQCSFLSSYGSHQAARSTWRKCVCVCVCAWGMAGKLVLLSRCERKGGKWGEQDGQKSVTPQTSYHRQKDSSCFQFQVVLVVSGGGRGSPVTFIDAKLHVARSYLTQQQGLTPSSNHSFLICSVCKGIHFVNTTISLFPWMYTWPWIFWPPDLLQNKHPSQQPQQLLSKVLSFNQPLPKYWLLWCNPNFLLPSYSTWPLCDLSVAQALQPLKRRTYRRAVTSGH